MVFPNTLPNVELHLHLEGSIPLPALWTLVGKYGGRDEVATLEALERRFAFTSFSHFIDTWVWKNRFIREYDDFTFIASSVAADLAGQGLRYVEAFYSPGDFHRIGLKPARITEAIRNGLDVHRDRITVILIADLIRDFGPDRGGAWLDEIREVRDQGVIGVGIGGSEAEFPPEAYEKIFERARAFGFRTTAHAGEAAGPASIWGAIRSLRVDRIGHGTRAVEDPMLMAYLKEHRIPIEACPISNVRTRIVPSLRSHPIRRFFDEGLLVSVNTDDPKMFQTSMDLEMRGLMTDLAFTPAEVRKVCEMAIESAWCDPATKTRLKSELGP